MKKILIALAAVAALAACSKSEVAYEQPGEIGIAPFAQNRTKAMVSGTEFPNEQFNVWAYYKQIDVNSSITEWQNSGLEQTTYINERPFAQRGETKLWGGVTSYFWPKLGSLMFVGYYPTTMAEKVDYNFSDSENKMTVTGYSPTTDKYGETGFVATDAKECEEDFMYFNMTANSCSSTTEGPENSVKGGYHVDVVFKHALSWLTVYVDRDDVNTPDNAKIRVTNISFTNITTTGDGVVDNSNPDATIKWSPNKGTADADGNFPNVTDVNILGANEKYLGEGEEPYTCLQPIVIPQEMEGDLVITYQIISEDDSYFEETKTISLAELHAIAGGDATFEAAKKYTYNILIGTSEILIDPNVAEWAETSSEFKY